MIQPLGYFRKNNFLKFAIATVVFASVLPGPNSFALSPVQENPSQTAPAPAPAQPKTSGKKSASNSSAQSPSAQKKSAEKKSAEKKSAENKSAQNATSSVSDVTISAIEIQGNGKIEKDAILSRVKSKVGEKLTESNIREDIKSLFKSGFFSNVAAFKDLKGGQATLIFKVVEKPSITEIVYEGNTELKPEDLAEAAGIKNYELLSVPKVKDATEKIQKLYEDKGFFLARVDYEIKEVVKDQTVKILFKIRENEKVKVKKITILGNKALSDSTLKAKLLTQEGGFFSGISGSGAYKQEAFDRDIQFLQYTYWNNGYLQVKVDRPQVFVTPDKKSIYITIRVQEGQQYSVGDISFSGDILFPRDELLEGLKIRDNTIFVFDVVQKDLAELQAKYGDLGYAYANVIPRYSFDEAEKKVNLVFDFNKGQKVYFGHINVVGNSKTRDKVLRRELKIKEGELYNETKRRESLESLQRLGFFDDVNFRTSTDPERSEIMNLDVVVKERNTGQIQLGAGYGTSTGFTLQGSVQQSNFLGKGQNLGVSLNLSSSYSVYDITFTEPYYNDTLWSTGFRLFSSNSTGRADYGEEKYGGSLFLGHPVSEYSRVNISYSLSKTRLYPTWDAAGSLITDFQLFPLTTAEGVSSMVGASYEFDNRNDRFKPTKGWLASLGYSQAGLGGDLRYYKANAGLRFFKNLFWDVVWRNSLGYAIIGATDPGQSPPFNELNLLGGPYSLRGYRYYRVGKQTVSNKLLAQYAGQTNATILATRYVGGTQQALYQTELQFPLIKEADMYGVAFYDVGQAEDTLTSQKFYADVGFGIRWFSPIGPLRFEWGFPLNRDADFHEPSVFEFSIGTPF